jgi:TolB-like protein
MKKIILMICLIAGMGAVLFAQQLTVAVRVFETSGGLSQDEGNAITDIFISELVSTGKVIVVDRNSFEAIVAEMKFGASSWSDNNNVARLGKALNASYIIQGTVTSLGGRIVVTIRVLDINTIQFVASPTLQLAKMDEIFAKLTPFVRDLALNLSSNSIVYQVGKEGPSGGLVFYDKGSYSDGWRYLEAAPASYEFETRVSSNYSMPRIQKELDLCRAMNIKGFTGWRLPTANELVQIYGSLKQNGLGNFQDKNYLSSDTDSYTSPGLGGSTTYWYIAVNLRDGSRGGTSGLVRAVRQF